MIIFSGRRLSTAAVAAALLAACGGSSSHKSHVSLTTGAAAQLVIGQADFVSGSENQGGSVAANTISRPWGSPAVVGKALFLPDFGNNRVLGFKSVPSTNGASADFALGQSDLTSNGSGLSATALSAPEEVSSSAGKLVLVDADNARVLVWNTVPSTTGMAADVVVGQADMSSSSSACDAATLEDSEGALTAHGKLIVSDKGSSRVLIWDTIPTTNGKAADLVLGQADFTHCQTNAGGAASASTMNSPEGVWSDGTRLVVADSRNNRILIWNAFPTASGQAADVVLGQADFTGTGSDTTATALNWPVSVSSSGTQIAVADADNNRVLVWNAFPTANGAAADAVLGQPDFTSSGTGTSATAMSKPGSVLLTGDMLVVGEWSNNRYLIFQ